MKVFWSWQSDSDGNIGRHFVREALEVALQQLKLDLELEAAERPDDIVLDHDRKGVPGSPALAELIYRKISEAHVFVADVTPVGATIGPAGKKLINSNVAIELGFALALHTDERLVMVLNTAFGTRDDLPFDLKHKAGPLQYQLSPAASKDEIAAQTLQLAVHLKIALRAIVDARMSRTGAYAAVPHIANDPARYFQPDQLVVDREGNLHGRTQKLTVSNTPLVFLRVLPSRPRQHLTYREAEQALSKSQVGPFGGWRSMSVETNSWGAIAFQAHATNPLVLNATQLHLSGEVWGFDTWIASPSHTPKDGGPPGIFAVDLEEIFQTALPSYIALLKDTIGEKGPYRVIAGATRIREHILVIPSALGITKLGPYLADSVNIDVAVADAKISTINAALLKIYEGFFDMTGGIRPPNFRNFPPKSDVN